MQLSPSRSLPISTLLWPAWGQAPHYRHRAPGSWCCPAPQDCPTTAPCLSHTLGRTSIPFHLEQLRCTCHPYTERHWLQHPCAAADRTVLVTPVLPDSLPRLMCFGHLTIAIWLQVSTTVLYSVQQPLSGKSNLPTKQFFFQKTSVAITKSEIFY